MYVQDTIVAPTTPPGPGAVATIVRLEANNAELRTIIRQLRIDKRNLATENLSLLHRARLAEDRLRVRDRELAVLKGSDTGARAPPVRAEPSKPCNRTDLRRVASIPFSAYVTAGA